MQSIECKRIYYRTEDPLSITTFSTANIQEKSSTELNGHFIHSQLLIDTLLRMKPVSTDKNELITFCKEEYKNNTLMLSIIAEFEKDYTPERALWWYTRESFLYRMLNKALRTQDIDLLFLFRFFLRDLQKQLKLNQMASSIRVYRAQLISSNELEMMKQGIGHYLSMNSFLSTSIDRQLALFLLGDSNTSSDSLRVLFEIDLDPQVVGSKPFADITSLSYFNEENEVLIMLGSIFRVENIYMNENQIWIIRMTLSSEEKQEYKTLFDFMNEQYQREETSLLTFGDALWRMGKFDDAEKYCHRLLNELDLSSDDMPICYYVLGLVASAKGNFDSSLEWHHKCLALKLQATEHSYSSLGDSYNSIGHVYKERQDYKQALESYEMALTMYKKVCGDDHPRLAVCFNNMANLYNHEKNHFEALKYQQMALNLFEKHRPTNHPDLGAAHNTMGSIYGALGEYDLALKHFKLSLNILEKSMPAEHPDIAMTLENIGLAYEDNNELENALDYYQRAATIYRQSLPRTHPRVIEIEQDVQRILSDLDSSKFEID